MDVLLVKRAQRRDMEAFVELMEKHKTGLYKVAKSYLRSEEDVADVMQETVLSVYEHIQELKSVSYFNTWMTRILINCAHEEWERRGKYDLAEDTVFAAGESFPKEETLDLYRAIDHLNYPYRDIIIQYYFAGNKLSEIAQSLDIPVGTVKVYHSRAKRKLKCMLEAEA